jgi:hypothetical protein
MKRPGTRVASVLVVGSGLILAACSGAPTATSTTTSSTSAAPRTTAARCSAASVSAAVVYTAFGGANSSVAGAVVFKDTGTSPCSLQGEPHVQVSSSDGSAISTYQAPGPTDTAAAVLTPSAGSGAQAASSITFSDWMCKVGTFSLSVRFPGWSSALPAGTGAGSTTSTTSAGAVGTTPAPCAQSQVTGQTVYVSPVVVVPG